MKFDITTSKYCLGGKIGIKIKGGAVFEYTEFVSFSQIPQDSYEPDFTDGVTLPKDVK